MGRTVSIGYTDSFNSSGNPTTYAYPTTLTDPANYSSTIRYRYDMGANVSATGPAPAGQTFGKTSKREFDSVGRLEKQSLLAGSTLTAYTRYARPNPDNGKELWTYSTLVDVNSSGGPGYIHAHIEAYRGRGVPNANPRKFPDQDKRAYENQRLRNATRQFFPNVFCPR